MTTPTAGPRARGSGSPWSPGSPEGPGRFARRTVASFATYAEAERAVDRLADLNFPVERVAVLGQDLQTVEQVTGKLDYWGAAWRGALSGAVPGLLIGWLFGLFSWAAPLVSSVLLALYGLLVGALIGAVMGLIVHAMTGGRRDFTSVMAVLPQRYELVVDDEVADRAVQLLGSAT